MNCDIYKAVLFREEIASCMEAAYKRILFSEAGSMLCFKKQEELTEFLKEVIEYKTLYFALNKMLSIFVYNFNRENGL